MTDEARKEPTTAELFEAVRRERFSPRGRKEDDGFETALTLLERHMGALEEFRRVFLEVALLPLLVEADTLNRPREMTWFPSGARAVLEAHEACGPLTDAPPVFTLEEARDVLWNHHERGTSMAADDVEAVMRDLSALRSTGGERRPSPAETLIYERGGSSVGVRTVVVPLTPPAPFEESRALVGRAAAFAEAAGAKDIAGALLLLAEVIKTRAGES